MKALSKCFRTTEPKEHELFRHVELELFVQQDQLERGLSFLKSSLEYAGRHGAVLDGDFEKQVAEACCQELLNTLRGKYCHHYPICIRKILPDDTLISMASNAGGDTLKSNQPWYSITLTNYHRGTAREPFYLLAEFLTKSMSRQFGARPHWGKLSQFSAVELPNHYPAFERFGLLCEQVDPQGVFRNRWQQELLKSDSTKLST